MRKSKLNTKEIATQIMEIVNELSEKDIDIYNFEGINLANDYNFDSIMFVQLISEIEEKFNIVIKDEDLDMDNLINVSNMVSLIEKNLGK